MIGGWDYTDAYCAANPTVCSETDGPEDENGHGSHTASTAAGNVLLSPAVSGVAPHANVIAYDSCYTDAQGRGLCPFTSTSAAADQALLDGVDVVNYSIGGGDSPWGGDIDTFLLELDGDAYDNLNDVFVKTVAVAPGSKRLIAATQSDEAPDVDLFVGRGNTPSAATQVCASTTATATELCEIDNPQSGNWWILVQNWAGSADQPDAIDLLDGLVPGSSDGSLTTTAPASVTGGDPFDILVGWDLSGFNRTELGNLSQYFFGAFSIGEAGQQPLETVYVVLELEPDLIFADGFDDGTSDNWTDTQE